LSAPPGGLYPGQFLVEPLERKGELVVVDAEQVQHGRVQIPNVDRVLHDVVTEVIGLAVVHAAANAVARQPGGKAARVVVASVVSRVMLPWP